MVLANREFNHEQDNFHCALGISDDTRTRCRERIFFSAFSNALQREELFEDEEDAPKSLRTVTGDLQRCLRLIKDPLEYEYTLIIFNASQRMAMESFAYYKHITDSGLSKEDRVKIKMMELMDEMRHSDDDDDADQEETLPINTLTRKHMVKRVKFAKDSHHNFDTYLNMLHHWAGVEPVVNSSTTKKSDSDIDDLLRGLFSND